MYDAVVRKERPTQEDIDALHERVMAALLLMFDTHKALMPDFAGKELRIV